MDLEDALFGNLDARRGLKRLTAALVPASERAHAIAQQLLDNCAPDSPMAALIGILRDWDEDIPPAKANLLAAMTARMQQHRWTDYELWRLRQDLITMSLIQSNWPLPVG